MCQEFDLRSWARWKAGLAGPSVVKSVVCLIFVCMVGTEFLSNCSKNLKWILSPFSHV